jgi:hypothetical protein
MKIDCAHGVIGYCERCWAEGFRQRRLNNPDYRRQVEALREKEGNGASTTGALEDFLNA